MPHQTAFALPASRYTAGDLDHSFACSGKTQVYFAGSTTSLANSVEIDPNGRVLVAATVGMPNGSCFGLARLLEDGSADLAFGTDGSVIGQFQRGNEAMAGKVHVLANGHILVAGLHYESAHRTLPALALFDSQGHPVEEFADNGLCVVRLPGNLSLGMRNLWLPPGVPGAEACDVQVQTDGRILLLANHHFELADHVGLLIRLTCQGELDTSFNGRGFVIVRHLLMNSWLSSLMVQRDGRIMVGGSVNFPEEGLLARYLPDGRLDESFAVDGFMTFRAAEHGAQVSQIIEQDNGDLQCLGSSRDPMQCLALKIHSNGRPDVHCNGGQPQLLKIGRSGCQWTAARRQSDGRVLAVGATLGGIEADFLLARYLPGGQLDPGFAEGTCWVRTRLGRHLDTATSVAIQADGRIVVGGYSLDDNYKAVVVRYLG
ncbi:delta-60 repeat domain-containing protein [Pseudomonas sp. CLCA07]